MTKLLASVMSCMALIALSVSLRAQSAAPSSTPPAFEVASVKINNSGDLGGGFGLRPGGVLVVTNGTLRNIIRNAYQLQNSQIVGGPDWLDEDHFDINAKSAGREFSFQSIAAMVQTLLADRFKLVVHRETRQLPVYALVMAKADGTRGAHLQPSTVNCAALADAARAGGPPPPGGMFCGTRTTPGRLTARAVTMADLARNVSNFAGRITIDKTGLAGPFDVDLEWTPDQLPPEGSVPAGMPGPPVDGPSLFTALQEQLGIKLDSQRAPIEVLVIDSAERPTPD